MESELALEMFSIRRIGILYSNQSFSPDVHLVDTRTARSQTSSWFSPVTFAGALSSALISPMDISDCVDSLDLHCVASLDYFFQNAASIAKLRANSNQLLETGND
jgi:hypothetical protein